MEQQTEFAHRGADASPRSPRFAVYLALAGMMLWPEQSQAIYLDPGTGSIVLQAVIGAVAGGWLLFRTKVAAVRGWLGRRGDSEPDEPEATDQT